ncbi:uncharacterized protein METZ01_LOCUS96099 [marine metagenome]|uniref:Uncharacterized protein n=1 Tax=marine metagenome TaxID=408172 RepID=A0A381VSJ8_9ZZZZ
MTDPRLEARQPAAPLPHPDAGQESIPEG